MCCCLWVPMCRMLAYRAEDISKRLVPHELYNREELEESVQFDVSLLCGAHITNLHSLILPLPSLSLYNPSCLNLYVSSSTSLHHPSLPSLRTSLLSPSLHLILSYHDHIFPLTHPHLLHSPHPPYLHLHASTGGRDVYSDMDEVLCETSTGETTATTA